MCGYTGPAYDDGDAKATYLSIAIRNDSSSLITQHVQVRRLPRERLFPLQSSIPFVSFEKAHIAYE